MVEKLMKTQNSHQVGESFFTSDQKFYFVNSRESFELSAPEFCRKNGPITPALYTWRKNSKRGVVMGTQKPLQGNLFVGLAGNGLNPA